MKAPKGVMFTNIAGGKVWIRRGDFGSEVHSIEEIVSNNGPVTQIIAGGYRTTVKESIDDVMKAFGCIVNKPDAES